MTNLSPLGIHRKPQLARKFDASRFEDEIANKIDWSPVSARPYMNRAHKIVAVSPSKIEFRAPILKRRKLLAIMAVIVVAPLALFLVKDLELWIYGASVSCGLGFVSFFLIREKLNKISFDFSKGLYGKSLKGVKTGLKAKTLNSSSHHCLLDEIHAIQIISEWIHDEGEFNCKYELNLVLKNARRLNAIAHDDIAQLRIDAEILSAKMGVPIWDCTLEELKVA